MHIGIMSDSHDDVESIHKAIAIFKEHNIETVLHAGDFVAPTSILEMKEIKPIAVLGNNDADYRLERFFNEIGGELKGTFAHLQLGGLEIALYHGTDAALTESLIESQTYDVVITGHTHAKDERTVGNTLAINPGSVTRYGDDSGVAILDTDTKKVSFYPL